MRIRRFRLEQEMAQDKLALMIGSSKGKAYISRIELDKLHISISAIHRIAMALDVEVRDLISFSGKKPTACKLKPSATLAVV
ncbi:MULTISPECIES: helix-turn-helix domain-containing protein [Gordonibacter]|uniref:Helix-turn-helix domain-containing protein n=1 Tax=Gordonibacter urolithinfaciens TaxID=1335613 RepID=A0A6N8IK80_9ACTN|nr:MULTISPECIES: helix-turn-helix transcriptional regulator [Gordonibacter]MDN4468808.1 helix-turn-helix domain-containing protein [Gordonibacter sp. RACS_AR68]MVM55699.1 helix-turn-helix domain-containing protein [Gordonibacter urolithinfaciens]MVN16304.1 helix-turn-helix domain-containing protein [Gordonibacter urolithinfaciens]MVN39632.1 helix-turn-helix domain-containing protein [Gordonibacter urolithinfaciens]MVN56711.1 helix-turn-helix domain-containing protein [Gordonibacter urolithinfa